MKKNSYKNICCLILTLIICILSFVFLKRPFYKNIKLEENSSNSYYKVYGGKKDSFFKKIRSNYVSAFEIYSQWSVKNINLEITIYDEKDEMIYHNILQNISNSSPNLVILKEPIVNRKNEKIKIVTKILNANHNIYLLKNNNSEIRVDEISHQKNYEIYFFLYLGLFIILIILFYFNIFKNEKIKKECKKLTKCFLFAGYFLGTILFSFLSFYFVFLTFFKHHGRIYLNFLLLILLFIIAFLAIYLLKKCKGKLPQLFLILAIPISSIYCVYFMPGSGQDEIRHYARVYQIVTGQKADNVGKIDLPNHLPYMRGFTNIEKFVEKLEEETDYEDTYKADKASYIPILYSFSILPVYICKELNINLYVGWYIAKICTMIFSILGGYMIIRKSPSKYKLLFLLYLLIPMNIYQYVTLSADTVINLATLYFFALALNKYESKEKLTLMEGFIITILSYILLFSKNVYFPILLFFIFLIRKNIKKSSHWLLKSLLVGLGIIFLYSIFKGPVVLNAINIENPIYQKTGIGYVVKSPFRTISAFKDYVISSPDQYLLDFIGYKFIWSAKSVPTILACLYFIILLMACFNDHRARKIDNITKIIAILCFLCSFGFICLGMYAIESHSNPLLGVIWGVQGRYLFPAYILLFICLSNRSNIFNFNPKKLILLLFLLVQLFYIYNIIYFVV